MSRLSKIRCEVVRSWYCNKVMRDLVHHDKFVDGTAVKYCTVESC